MSATRALLPDGRRWHFQQGPIDLVIEAWGDAAECARAYEQAWARFETVLGELVSELPILRKPVVAATAGTHLAKNAMRGVCGTMGPRLRGDDKDLKWANPLAGAVARRMWFACAPYAHVFITPMAAVAGAVADEILAAMTRGRALRKAYVNNGGDIALHLAPGETFETGIVGDLSKPKITATARIAAEDRVGGIATSGWRGRSFSLGIADSATILARDAASADAAATIVANAVTIDHPSIGRRPARALDPDSDLGDHLVTVEVGPIDAASIVSALEGGERAARRLSDEGLIAAAYLELGGHRRTIGTANTEAALAVTPPKVPTIANELAWSLRQ